MAHCAQSSETFVTEMSGISLNESCDQLEQTKHTMLQRLSFSDAFFKHQQRGEPDMTSVEKYKIAEDILSKNKTLFLERFWKYLGIEDMAYFKQYENEYEIDFYLKQICKSKTSNFDKNRIKNRRFKAMQQLLSEGDYFSDDEMKYRDPLLYEQLIGRYLTDDEVNDKIDKTDLRFSTILFKHIDILQENELYQDQKDTEEGQTEEEEDCEDDDNESEMEDNDTSKRETIPDEQKATLRQEFLTIMQERFMSGQDKHFNYSEVDNNTEYDDLDILQKDEEEKYFDNDDESDHEDLDNSDMDCYIPTHTCMKHTTKQQNVCDASECNPSSVNPQTGGDNSGNNCISEFQNCTDQT